MLSDNNNTSYLLRAILEKFSTKQVLFLALLLFPFEMWKLRLIKIKYFCPKSHGK
jgi:hypothetical protein